MEAKNVWTERPKRMIFFETSEFKLSNKKKNELIVAWEEGERETSPGRFALS